MAGTKEGATRRLVRVYYVQPLCHAVATAPNTHQRDRRLEEIIGLATESTYTKFPVYEENLDQVIGIVHVKDLLKAMQSPDCQGCTARRLMREPLFVPVTLHVSALLRRFRDHRQHSAIVLDEFGGTAGLVTLEDLMEEIVGEVSDPFDISTPDFQTLADGSVLIDGLTLIESVNEQLGLNLKDADYDTLAGYVLGKLGRMPRLQDSIETEGVNIRVEELDGMSIARLAVSRKEPTPSTPDDSTATNFSA